MEDDSKKSKGKKEKVYEHKRIWSVSISSPLLFISLIVLIIAYVLKISDLSDQEGGAIGILVLAPLLLLFILISFLLSAASLVLSIVGTHSSLKGIRITNWALFGVSIFLIIASVVRLLILGIY